MTISKIILPVLVALLLPAAATARNEEQPADTVSEPVCPVTASYTLSGGWARMADTYLTPLHYDGFHTSLAYSRLQALRSAPRQWSRQLNISLGLDHTENPARNATMWHLDFNAGVNFFRKFTPRWGLTVAPGLGLGAEAGALYLARNGNNPISAKASITLNASALIFKPIKIGKIHIDLTYQPTLPLTGAFFSPDYGELYYEIYLGNHKGLVHAAWPGNYFRLDNLLTADIHLGKSALRIGYANTIFSSKANNIVTRITSHALVIGLTTSWLSVSPYGKHRPSAGKLFFGL